MNDHRWRDVLSAATSAARHFEAAAELFAEGGFAGPARDAYRRQMALMHAMQAGYTSFESALVRVMTMLGEDKPSGSDWHRQLVERSGEAVPGLRGAIVTPEIARLSRKLRAFRHWAMHAYDEAFDPDEAAGAVQAASRLAALIGPALEAFAREVDP